MNFNQLAVIALLVFHGVATLGGSLYGAYKTPAPVNGDWYLTWITFCILLSAVTLGSAYLVRATVKSWR